MADVVALTMYKAAMPPFPRKLALFLLACLAFSGEAFGCSFPIPVKVFEPDVVAANRGADLLQMPGPPPVAVQVSLIRRTSSMYACDHDAEFDLVLSWAEPTSLRLEDVGFYVQQVSADAPGARKGFFPEMARVVDGKAHLTLRTVDSPPGGVLDFDVDIFAIDRGLRIGPTTRFHVHSDAEPAEVRQSSGRVARLLIVDEAWRMRIAAAEWVDGTDTGDWTRVASAGCQAMTQMAAAREAAFVDDDRAKHDRRHRRP